VQIVSPANNGMLRINGANTTIGHQSLGGTPNKTLRVFNGSGTGATALRVQESSAQSGAESFGVYANDDTTPRMVVKGASVGIGTASPSTTLHVVGDATVRSLISSGGTITLSSYTVATLPTAASNAHAIVAVTDGNASPTYRGAVTGGGSTKGVVYCDGSSWMWH